MQPFMLIVILVSFLISIKSFIVIFTNPIAIIGVIVFFKLIILLLFSIENINLFLFWSIDISPLESSIWTVMDFILLLFGISICVIWDITNELSTKSIVIFVFLAMISPLVFGKIFWGKTLLTSSVLTSP